MSGNTSNRKRQYTNNNARKNPPRGSPGILLTCDRGREGKCKREGLEILKHYYYKSISSSPDTNEEEEEDDDNTPETAQTKTNDTKDTTNEKKVLTLEEEIAMLRKGASSEQVLMERNDTTKNNTNNRPKGGYRNKDPFTVYSTGVNGNVFVMCTLPNSRLIPQIKTEYDAEQKKKREEDRAAGSGGGGGGEKRTIDQVEGDHNKQEETSTKKTRQDDEKESSKAVENSTSTKDSLNDNKDQNKNDCDPQQETLWDPIETMKTIVANTEKKNNDAPGSRYVTRMIPIQATCYTSIEEIQLTSKALIEKFLMPHGTTSSRTSNIDATTEPPPLTFAIKLKRRACDNVTRDEIVKVVGDEVSAMKHGGSQWQVNLNNPRFTILIEICKTLCGMSVIENYQSFSKFNISAAQDSTDE